MKEASNGEAFKF